MNANAATDPITLEIIQNSLQATADEMFAAMRKTAMSAIIYEVLDMGTGITDARGDTRLVRRRHPGLRRRARQGGEGDPQEIRQARRHPARRRLRHQRPVSTAASPISTTSSSPCRSSSTGEIIAWTANIAHWNSDVGGMTPGSMSTEATEIFQEGLRLPAIKMIDEGRRQSSRSWTS